MRINVGGLETLDGTAGAARYQLSLNNNCVQ